VDQNNQDQPLSSEEMLRKAREGFGESRPESRTPDTVVPSPSTADYQPSYAPEFEVAPEPEPATRSIEYEVAPLDPEPDLEELEELEPEIPEMVEETTPTWAPPPPPSAEDDNVASWAPPPPIADRQSSRPAPPVPKEPRTTGSGVNIGRLISVLVGIAVLGVFVFNMFDSSKAVDDIAVGDCMDIPEDDEFSSIDPIDCADPHDLEVFAVIDMGAVSGEYAVGATFPGGDSLYFAALDECVGQPFTSFVGSPFESIDSTETVLWVDAFTPTIEGWEEFNDREVQCVLLQLDTESSDVVKTSGSLRNSSG
jgi:hypothetical protein